MAAVGSRGNGSQDKGYTREAAGVKAGHDKGAQNMGLGLGHWTAHDKGGSGGKEMNEDECPPPPPPPPPFYKSIGQLKGPGNLRAIASLILLL